jgi:dipeptidyl aminopeptidase/acylaminoacyl peptidase
MPLVNAPRGDVIATFRGEVIALTSDQVVAFGPSGASRLILQERGTHLRLLAGEPMDALAELDVLTLLARHDGQASEVISVNVSTGEVVHRRTIGGDVLAVSARGESLLTRTRNQPAGALSLHVGADEREVFRFNQGMADVIPAVRRAIRYAGADGEPLVSWLLTPEGVNEPRPTIVTFYPGTVYSESYQPFAPTDFSFINAEVLVGHGYNVLFVSVPMSRVIPRDVAEGLAAKLDRAVEAAIATGLVDGSRLGLQGHSFGGWGTATVLTQSTRYRAAIALSGLYNLTSFYGAFNAGRLDSEAPYPALNWSERSQPGLGLPPWRDPPRYIRNSPVFQADRIQTPLLLIHGDHDWVSVNQAEEMFSALVRLDRDAQLVRYYGEDHHLSSSANIRDMWGRIFAWYDAHLTATNADAAPHD